MKQTNTIIFLKSKLASYHLAYVYSLFMIVIILFMGSNNCVAQAQIIIDEDKLFTVDEVFNDIKDQTDYGFIYQKGLFSNVDKIKLEKGVFQVNSILQRALPSGDFNYSVTDDNIILIKKIEAEVEEMSR